MEDLTIANDFIRFNFLKYINALNINQYLKINGMANVGNILLLLFSLFCFLRQGFYVAPWLGTYYVNQGNFKFTQLFWFLLPSTGIKGNAITFSQEYILKLKSVNTFFFEKICLFLRDFIMGLQENSAAKGASCAGLTNSGQCLI